MLKNTDINYVKDLQGYSMNKTKEEPKFLWRLLFALLFVTPLLYTNITIDWIIPIRSVFAAIVIVLTAAYSLRRKLAFPTALLKNRSFQFLILYILAGLITFFSALNKHEFFAATSLKLLLPLLIVGLYIIFRNIENPVEKSSSYVIYGSFVFTLISLLQVTFNVLEFIPSTFLGSSTFANVNMLTTAVIMSLPFSVYGIYKLGVFERIFAYCNVFMTAYVVTILRTRSVWLASSLSLIVVLGLLLFLKRKAELKLWNKPARNIMILILIAVLAASAAYVIIEKYFPDSGSTQRMRKDVLGGSTVAVRLDVWKKSMEMIKEHPLIGVGSGNWSLNINKYGTEGMRSEKGELSYRRPHNDYIWIASENGIVILILYAAFLLSIYISGIKNLLKGDRVRWENLIALFGIKVYGIIALFSFPGERVYNLSLLALFCVIIILNQEESDRKKFEKYPWVVYTLVAVIFLGVSVSRFQSDVFMRKIADTRQEIDQLRVAKGQKRIPAHSADLRINSLRSAITKYAQNAYTPVYSVDPTVTHVLAFKAKMLFDMGKYNESLTVYLKTLEENPYHLYTMFSTALTYEKLRKTKEELEMHNKILEIAPSFPGSLLELSAKSALKGDTESAYEYFIKVDKQINIVRYNAIAMSLTEQYLKKSNNKKAREVFSKIEGDIPVPQYKELKEILGNLKQ